MSYNSSQPRDPNGKWDSSGGSSSGSAKTEALKAKLAGLKSGNVARATQLQSQRQGNATLLGQLASTLRSSETAKLNAHVESLRQRISTVNASTRRIDAANSRGEH